jgi:hypothetical protein
MRVSLDQMSDDSKVWIYTANRRISKEEQEQFTPMLDQFAAQWTAHKLNVKATVFFEGDYLLVLMADESLNPVSGCSIDSSVHFVQELGNKMNIDFFNRHIVLVKDNEQLGFYGTEQLSELSGKDDCYVLNSLVNTKKSFIDSLYIPFQQSLWSRVNLIKSDFTLKL